MNPDIAITGLDAGGKETDNIETTSEENSSVVEEEATTEVAPVEAPPKTSFDKLATGAKDAAAARRERRA